MEVSALLVLARLQRFDRNLTSQAIGLPTSAAYSASKAALTKYLEAARVETWNENISVITISPGFIDTAMARRVQRRAFVMDERSAASEMVRIVENKAEHRYVPWFPWVFLMFLLQFIVPTWLFANISNRVAESKKADKRD